ncbi:MAG: hypothetical protein PWQ37_141 [Candidatus Petromonas sp.]|nr:hypothetical protein [Candidatus Petromonas sp.]
MDKNVSSLVKAGNRIEIEIEEAGSSIRMKSDVIKVTGNNTIAVSSPIYKGKIYPISNGSKISIIFYKKNTGKFYFLGEVVKRDHKNNLSILYIKKISDIFRLQRRSYFRLSIVLNLNIDIVENGTVIKSIPAISKDISGGGLRIICKEKVKEGTLVSCNIPIDDEQVKITGKIVRCEAIPDSINKHDIGIEFVSIDEKIRTKIISFIFDKQRKLIKKGLI